MPSPATPMENPIKGLSSSEVRRILGRIGPNATPDVAVHPLRLVLGKFLAPVSVLLEIAIVLQLALGEYVEASIIAALLIFNTAIGFFHESRAQSTIAALKSRLALNASVLRDGAWTIAPATDLVPRRHREAFVGNHRCGRRPGARGFGPARSIHAYRRIPAGRSRAGYRNLCRRPGSARRSRRRVLATGERTKFGRTAELVRTAYVVSTEQKAVFRVVRNLAGFNGAVTVLLMVYAYEIGMPLSEAISLMLIIGSRFGTGRAACDIHPCDRYRRASPHARRRTSDSPLRRRRGRKPGCPVHGQDRHADAQTNSRSQTYGHARLRAGPRPGAGGACQRRWRPGPCRRRRASRRSLAQGDR